MEYKIIACDLDGTLLTSSQEVSVENNNAIKELAERGVFFAPCTGRTFSQIPEAVKGIKDARYFLYSNGSVILDRKTGECSKECLPRELSKKVFDIFSEYDTNPIIHTDGQGYTVAATFTPEGFLYYQADRYFFDLINPGTLGVDDIRSLADSDTVEMYCCLFHSDKELAECRERIAKTPGLRYAASTAHNIEVFSEKAGKGNAILRFADELGIDRAATIAVGDSINDLTMVQKAGLGLAVKNAMPGLLAEADEVICSNEEHCAEYILNKFIKG